MILQLTETVQYNTELPYNEQSDEFKAYAMELYEAVPKLPYPPFDADGNISYSATDSRLNYQFKRVQAEPFSQMNRAVSELITLISEV